LSLQKSEAKQKKLISLTGWRPTAEGASLNYS